MKYLLLLSLALLCPSFLQAQEREPPCGNDPTLYSPSPSNSLSVVQHTPAHVIFIEHLRDRLEEFVELEKTNTGVLLRVKRDVRLRVNNGRPQVLRKGQNIPLSDPEKIEIYVDKEWWVIFARSFKTTLEEQKEALMRYSAEHPSIPSLIK